MLKFNKTILTVVICCTAFVSNAQWNTSLGTSAGTQGQRNTNLGWAAGQFGTGQNNVNIGLNAGYQNLGSHNVYIGRGAGEGSTSSTGNVFLGFLADGSNNVFIGYTAGQNEMGSNLLYIANSSASPLIGGDFLDRKVGIALDNICQLGQDDAKLMVNGGIAAEEIKVEIEVGTCPDYVFKKDYRLRPLEEVQSHIEKHNHLPEVPSAKEMESEGLELGEMNMLLLKKIEELTLYLLEQDKEIKQLNAKVQSLEES